MASKTKIKRITGGEHIQLPFAAMMPRCDWEPTAIAKLPSWEGAKRIAFDVETRDPQLRKLGCGVRRDGYMVGYSFAIEDGPAHYVPFRHEGGGNLDRETAFKYLRDQAKHFRGELVLGSAQYDLDYASTEAGADFKVVKYIRDVQVAEPILDEYKFNYNLDALAECHNLAKKDERVMRGAAEAYGIDPKAGLWRLPAKYVGDYAIRDVRLPLELLRKQERLIDEQDLWDVWNLESRLLPALVAARQRGVRINLDRLDQMDKWAFKKEREAYAEIKRLTGVSMGIGDVNKVEGIVAPLLISLGVELPRTAPSTTFPDGKWSVTKDVLESIGHPVGVLLRTAKKMVYHRSTFVGGVRDHLVGDRLHCTFNQLKRTKDGAAGGKKEDTQGTVTGRMAAAHPNLQNQPVRDPVIGYPWRGIYLPDEGGDWFCNDYSTQEPRLIIHFAELCGYPSAKIAADKFRKDPNIDYHETMAEITGLPRDDAKQILLGMCYGMGGAKLCRSLGLPTEWITWKGRRVEVAGKAGKRVIDQFNATLPYVKSLAKKCEQRAQQMGYLTVLGGRRLRFEQGVDGNYLGAYKALNKLAQGSAAGQTKMAMAAAHEAGFPIQLQVHDELDFTAESKRQAEDLAELMRTIYPLNVPSKVDVEMGPSWGEINEKGRAACKAFYGN